MSAKKQTDSRSTGSRFTLPKVFYFFKISFNPVKSYEFVVATSVYVFFKKPPINDHLPISGSKFLFLSIIISKILYQIKNYTIKCYQLFGLNAYLSMKTIIFFDTQKKIQFYFFWAKWNCVALTGYFIYLKISSFSNKIILLEPFTY
jgi:hypothetical protein